LTPNHRRQPHPSATPSATPWKRQERQRGSEGNEPIEPRCTCAQSCVSALGTPAPKRWSPPRLRTSNRTWAVAAAYSHATRCSTGMVSQDSRSFEAQLWSSMPLEGVAACCVHSPAVDGEPNEASRPVWASMYLRIPPVDTSRTQQDAAGRSRTQQSHAGHSRARLSAVVPCWRRAGTRLTLAAHHRASTIKNS
jgi:hypothetical protein